MKPILFPVDATTFTTNGLGRMADAVSCRVTEERNGAYQLEMVYPVDGIHFADVAERMILYAIHDDRKDRQPFRIYEITRPMNGLVTIRARHISYDLNKIVVEPFTAGSCAAAMDGLRTHSATENPFTFWTDKETVADFSSSVPAACRSLLGGSQGSILDVYGTGEYAWDHWTVKLYLHRGRDTGVTIRYGKNLTDLEDTVDVSGTYNAVYPYWYSEEEGLVDLTEKVLYADPTDENGNPVDLPTEVSPLDLSSAWETKPTEEQLRQRAARYLTNNTPWEENRNIKVSFVALWQTEEYKDVAALERLCLCDTVTAIHKGLGVKAKKKIIKVVYDVLLERYQSMELGDTTKSFTSALKADIASQMDGLRESVPSKSFLAQSIERATDLLRGGMGGYVITVTNANGQPIEQLIVDNPDLSQATQVWRWNQNGLGYSSNGYAGPYTTAITSDGHIVANFIDTGTLTANIVKLGILADRLGRFSFNMETGDIVANNALLNNATATGSFTSSGVIWGYDGAKSYNFDMSLNSEGLAYDVDNNFGGAIGVSAAVSSTSGIGYDYKSLNLRTALDAITFSTDNPIGSEDAWTYYYALNNGLNPLGYTERHFFSEDIRSSGDIHTYSLYVGNGTHEVELRRGIFTGGEANLHLNSGLFVSGTKNRVVKTDNFGTLALNAMESTYAMFSDVGSGEIGEAGKTYVFLDPDFAETIDPKHEYQVLITQTGIKKVNYAEKYDGYFCVYGDPEARFDWIIYARQKDYVDHRLEQVLLEKDTNMSAGLFPVIAPDTVMDSAKAYLKSYEREVDPIW